MEEFKCAVKQAALGLRVESYSSFCAGEIGGGKQHAALQHTGLCDQSKDKRAEDGESKRQE